MTKNTASEHYHPSLTWETMLERPNHSLGQYYKNITIIRMTIVSDAPSCGIAYNRHSATIKVSFMLFGLSIMLLENTHSAVTCIINILRS
jgi:hypothetical protein